MVLLRVAPVAPDAVHPQQGELLLRVPIVPNRVAKALHLSGTTAQLISQVHVAVDAKRMQITITAVEPTAARAVTVVNTVAEQLVEYSALVAQQSYSSEVNKALDLTEQLGREQADIQSQLRLHPNSEPLKTEAEGLQAAFANASKAYAKVVSSGESTPPWRFAEATATALH